MQYDFSRLKIKVVYKFLDETTQTTYPTRKTQITRISLLRKMKSAYLKVQYLPGVVNEGTFETKADLYRAVESWTEEPLLKYIYSGGWE